MLAHNIVNGEIRTVLNRLKQSSSWSDEFDINEIDSNDQTIYRKFSDLRNKMTEKYLDPTVMDAEVLLAPFIETLKSPSVTGYIVDSILMAIDSFLHVGIISASSPNVSKAMSTMLEAVAKCRFEATDRNQDEVVLVHMLDLLRSSIILPIGRLLSDEDVWMIFDTVFASSQEPGYSPVLRRIAERLLNDITCIIFRHLYKGVVMTEKEQDSITIEQLAKQEKNRKMSTINNKDIQQIEGKEEDKEVTEEDDVYIQTTEIEPKRDPCLRLSFHLADDDYTIPPNEEEIQYDTSKPYGVSIAAKILTFLTTRINPNAMGVGLSKEESSDSLLLCIRLIRLGIETAGTTLTHIPEILHLISDEIFEHLIMLIQRSSTSYDIVTECMRIFTVISTVLRSRMKLQQEVFFQRVIIWGLKMKQSNPLFEELVLETLVDIFADPSFLIDMYVNYDCDSQRQDLLESLYNALNETVKDSLITGSTAPRVALRILYSGIKHIDFRCNELQHPTPLNKVILSDTRRHHESAQILWQKKLKKRTLLKGATIFNSDPKLGIKYLQEAGVIPNPATALDLAHILRFTPNLDKPSVGQYLGKNNDFNIEVLKEFVATFDFKDICILNALRMFLETFRLPGEAQQIDRIMETFANYAYEQTSDHEYLINPDVTYCLCFSIIMLNTDLHNPNISFYIYM
ncbi:hypothetical protein WA158_002731 [Blastocystis sp. Blastoise]